MSEEAQTPRPLEEAPMSELWQIAKSLGISKEGKKEDLIARIREARSEQHDGGEEDTPVSHPNESPRPQVTGGPQAQFRAAMQGINMALADHPGVLDIVKVKKTFVSGDSEMVRDAYSWAVVSPAHNKVRQKVRFVLEAAWQSGALNYEMIAKALRLPDVSVQALLDTEFIEANGL